MKHLTRLSWLLLTAYALTAVALAQNGAGPAQAETGSLAEIKARHKVYLEQANFNAHDILLGELAQERSLVIVRRAEEADFIISYDVDLLDLGNHQHVLSGQLVVFTLAEDPTTKEPRPRVLWTSSKHKVFSSGNTFNREAVTASARDFLKALQDARTEAEAYAGARKSSPAATPATGSAQPKPPATMSIAPPPSAPRKRKIENGRYLPDPEAGPPAPTAPQRRRVENGHYLP